MPFFKFRKTFSETHNGINTLSGKAIFKQADTLHHRNPHFKRKYVNLLTYSGGQR